MKPYLMSNFPSVRPSLNLQFDSQPTPADMTSHLASVGATFSRASIGTYTDANGLVAEATAGQARPNYSTAGVHEGLLIEEARTNNFKISGHEYIALNSSSNVFTGDYTITNFYGVAPNGKAQSTRLESGSGSGNGIRVSGSYFGTAVNTGNNTFSVYIKVHSFGTSGTPDIFFNGDGGRWVGITTGDVTIGEWTRIEGAYTPSSNFIDIECTANCDFEIWGIQNEFNQSFATSYIPTIPTFEERASPATFFDSDGVLQTQAIQTSPIGVGRTDHKYIDGEWVEAGLLLEAQSVNLIEDSEDFTGGTVWTITGTVTRTADQISAPDGNTTADLVAGTATTGLHYLAQNRSLSSSTTYTQSAFVKAEALNYCYLLVNENGSYGNRTQAYFDLTDGTLDSSLESGDFTLVSTDIVDVSNGWYRISMTFTTGTLTAGIARFGISDDGGTGSGGFLGDGSGVYMWGFQLEEQSQPTSYIATSGSTATRSADVFDTNTKVRSADVCYIDGTAFTDFYNQEEGTVLTDSKCGGYDTASAVFRLEQLSIIQQYFNDGIRTFFKDGDELNFESGYATPTSLNKIVITYDSSNLKSSINGESVNTVSVVDAYGNGDRLSIGGEEGNNDRYLNGSIKKLIYFPRRLSDNELIKLTQ